MLCHSQNHPQIVCLCPLQPSARLSLMSISLWLAAAGSFFGHPLHISFIGMWVSTPQFLAYDFISFRKDLAAAEAEINSTSGDSFSTTVPRDSLDSQSVFLLDATAPTLKNLLLHYLMRGVVLVIARLLVAVFSKLALCSEAESLAGCTRMVWARRRTGPRDQRPHLDPGSGGSVLLDAVAACGKSILVGISEIGCSSCQIMSPQCLEHQTQN